MAYRGILGFLIWFYYCSTSALRYSPRSFGLSRTHYSPDIFIVSIVNEQIGSENVCSHWYCPPAPLAHYKSLNCTPQYRDGYCCPEFYDCDHLYKREKVQKCFVNGHEYNIGESLKEEDLNLCDKYCRCEDKGEDESADFYCLDIQCPEYNATKPGCYQRNPLEECCATEEICPENVTEARPLCKIHGKLYSDEQYFETKDDPNSICICRAYDKGNFSLSCTSSRDWFDVHAAYRFYNDCIPVYLSTSTKEELIAIRPHTWRCVDESDFIIPTVWDRHGYLPKSDWAIEKHGTVPKVYCQPWYNGPVYHWDNPDWPCHTINAMGGHEATRDLEFRKLCRYAQGSLHFGDTLNVIKFEEDSCIACTCWVPPVPTCVLLQNTSSCNALFEYANAYFNLFKEVRKILYNF